MTQYDLPTYLLPQQSAARRVGGAELESFGKCAAASYADGSYSTLTSAVVGVVKSACLSPEQVKRVCEFANKTAFSYEFNKEGTAHRYVTFHGGPADAAAVLQDLNDGGGGTVFDNGMLDYAEPVVTRAHTLKVSMDKTASADVDPFECAFDIYKSTPPISYHSPIAEVEHLYCKLGSLRDATMSALSIAECELLDQESRLFGCVKEAAVDGTPLGHIVQAWHQTPGVNPVYVREAFEMLTPKLAAVGVFRTERQLQASLQKTAGLTMVSDQAHPIVGEFSDFCAMRDKVAGLRNVLSESIAGMKRLTEFMASTSCVTEAK